MTTTPVTHSHSTSTARTASAEGRSSSGRRAPRTLAGHAQSPEDASRKSTLALYENALRLMQTGKYGKAHTAFTEMLDNAPQDLADRIRMYIAACVAQISKGTTEFQSHEEHYDYAISLLNQGHYEDAREHFQQILLEDSTADYAFYGMALLSSMTGDAQTCIDHLTEAIRLNEQNRFQARLDSDFDAVSDDPRFTELLYPEATA